MTPKSPQIYCLLLTLTACSQDNKTYPRFMPQLNPQPKYFVTVEGYINPKLAQDINLTWHIAYITHNDDCREVFNPLEGVYGARSQEDSFLIKTDETNHYSYKIPIDKYLPGYCDWHATSMYYESRSKSKKYRLTSDFVFSHIAQTSDQTYWDLWKCNNKCELTQIIRRTKYQNLNSNYKYIVDIKKE